MSPVAIILDLLLVGLLVMALAAGLRLERQLKALRAGQAGFVDAVADLDRAARRAELGLDALRTATDEALDLLVGRIEKARDLSIKLETLTSDGSVLLERARQLATPQPKAEPKAPSASGRRTANLERLWPRAVEAAPAAAKGEPDLEAAAEAVAESLILKLSRGDVVEPPPSSPLSPRSRAAIDDDLFEAPSTIRAGPGGRS